MIEKLYKNGKTPVNYVNAVTSNICNRCGSKNLYKDENGYLCCLDCYPYGEVNESMKLYRFERYVSNVLHIVNQEYELTDIQIKGSKFLLDCFLKHQSGFLQAVCGAGKTEMTYEVILTALNLNKKVCFVIPRVQVLKEVYKRFKKVFSKTAISVLYEGKKDYENSNLIFSTPQQMIVFYKEFDLIILDEVDAFPYSGNLFLERLVNKALCECGVCLYMSATVSEHFKKKLDTIRKFLIPERYHKNKLIEPKFIRIKKNIFKTIKEFLDNNEINNIQTLIFVPTIKWGEEFCKKLIELGYSISFISSQTKYKTEIINQFRNQEIKFLLTTTVLERGVTFSNIDVFVLLSDHKVFNKEALIQISGRVGRNKLYPNGELLFFSEYTSKAMIAARNEITYMNIKRKENEMSDM